MIRHRDQMEFAEAENCHDGIGTLHLHTILTGSEGIPATFMHDDILDPGVTIGEHLHENSSEIYFVVEGDGIMIVDGKEHRYPPAMFPGAPPDTPTVLSTPRAKLCGCWL